MLHTVCAVACSENERHPAPGKYLGQGEAFGTVEVHIQHRNVKGLSISMRTIISSSTTRTRRPERDLLSMIRRRRNVDQADHALPRKIEPHGGFQLVRDPAFKHLGAKPPV